MLPSSVRRVVAAAPQSPVVSSLASSVPRTAGAYALSYKSNCHQRRLSSSKPSSPANGPKDFSARPSVHPSSDASKSSDAKSTGEKRKRKAKEVAPAMKPLPSVPSTQHLSQEALALSTFFSLHRPISVTHSFPKTITEDAFAEIFHQRMKAYKESDVISTLSHTVQELEQPLSKLNLNSQATQDTDESANDAMTRLQLKHSDGSETSVYLQLNSMSGQFLPFSPPPAPNAQSAEPAAEEALADAPVEAPQTRVYKAILTIEETTDASGQYKMVAHSPQLIEEGSVPRTFLERMALRQLRYEDDRQHGDDGMVAISVRRQKKLKMKKKKYKKLMRRTRNLRRKLDRN